MLHTLLQVAGGSFYFLNKLFFAVAERTESSQIQKKWRIAAWIVYLLGVSPWVIIFISEQNWIAAAIESSGVPAMLMGLVFLRRKESVSSLSRWLETLTKIIIIAGLGISLYDFRGITAFNQVLELGIAAGFLFGTYFLAKSSSYGYIWILFGNVSAAVLMMRQGYDILMTQQLLSILLVTDAFRSHKRRSRHHHSPNGQSCSP